MEKPLTLQIEEFKQNLATTINNSPLPSFIIASIIKDIDMEIQALYRNQVMEDKVKYEESLKETISDNNKND